MSAPFDLGRSRALWNRSRLDLESDEVLAQILDFGEVEAWREIYRRAKQKTPAGAALRRRILGLCRTAPLAFPHLFIAAMAYLENVEPYPDVSYRGDDLT